jgi:dihydroflavonol-4-reductase
MHTGTCHILYFSNNDEKLYEIPREGIPRFSPDKVTGAYPPSKAEGANIVLDAVENRGLDAVIALPTGIVGGYEMEPSNFGEMVRAVADKKLPVYLGGRYDFVDVRDVAWAMAEICEKGAKGESYNVSGNIVTVKDLIWSAAKAAGVKPPKIYLPLGFVKFFSYFAESYSRIFHKTLMFTPYAIKVLGDNCNFPHDKLTKLCGYAPKPINVSLEEQVQYYRNVYKPVLMGKKK